MSEIITLLTEEDVINTLNDQLQNCPWMFEIYFEQFLAYKYQITLTDFEESLKTSIPEKFI